MLLLNILLLITIDICAGARILGIAPTASYSHQIIFQPIFKELAKRGHDMVVLTTDPQKIASLPNLKEIDWSHSYDIVKPQFVKVVETGSNPVAFIKTIYEIMNGVSIYQLEHPEVAALIKNETEHFDLVMVEFLIPTMFAFKHRFNCPYIGITSLDSMMFGHVAVGNPVHQILYPQSVVPYSDNLNFYQRLTSFIFSHAFDIYVKLFELGRVNDNIKTYFGEGYPDIEEITNSVDMLFINANPVFGNIRPLTPATINIGGGIHLKDPKPLPKDLQTYLDGAKSGVIYFSLGSNVKSVDIPVETREMMLKVFSELPYKVLWKFEAEELPNKPANVKIQKWIPQQDVLRHPNVKLFITQGGLQSAEEALFSSVPIVVMPFFADQEFNSNKIVARGLGVSVDHKTMTADDFKNAILEVLNNSKYKNAATMLAKRIKDEPMTGVEKAVWWTEYVIRNKGSQHLKGPGIDLPLYQYYYLDIMAFTLAVFLLISAITYFVIRKILSATCRLFCKKKQKIQ